MMKTLILSLAILLTQIGISAERPNFLIIIGDDCTYNDLPVSYTHLTLPTTD